MYAVMLLTLFAFIPENLQSWYSSCSEGDWATAAERAEEILASDSTDTEALAAIVIASVLENDLNTGTDYIMEESSVSDSLSSLSRTALGALLMSGTDTLLENAENQLSKSIWLEPENIMAWYFMGILKMEDDSAAAALNCFSEVVSLDPEFLPAQLEISRLFLELKEYRRAIVTSRNLLESATADSVEAQEILGAAYFGNHEINEAKEVFLILLEIDPMSIPALVYLGDIAEQEARTEEAVNYYLSALELDTNNEEARSRLRVIAGDSYNPESNAESLEGFSAFTAADFSIERGNRALLEWGGSASISYRFDSRGTSVNAFFGGRSVTWEETCGLKKNTLNTNRGWASIGIDYWFSDSYYVEAASNWDRQMYTERPWQISSYAAAGWQKWMLSWFWFSPKIGLGSVNSRWTSGAGEAYTNDLSVYAAAGLRYRKPHTFIREAEISGNVYFPPDNPSNFISEGRVSLAFRTWSPLYVSIGYIVDYTRTPEISTWKKFNTSFTTSINFDLL